MIVYNEKKRNYDVFFFKKKVSANHFLNTSSFTFLNST